MNKDRSSGLFLIGDELLTAAEHELQRAEEDVVSHLVCMNSRQALSNYFAGFLLRQNVLIEHPVTIESLFTQCESIDTRFKALDLSSLKCRHENKDNSFCFEQATIHQCFSLAQHIRDIIMDIEIENMHDGNNRK